MTPPELSVVVAAVDGGQALRRCLDALASQVDAPPIEIIVPYDDTIPEVRRLAEEFPAIEFLDMGSIADEAAGRDAFSQHALIDRRRTAGLLAARGDLVAMLEERGWPHADWARRMVALHRDTHCDAIGGVIENGDAGALQWALYFCDFGRFQPPLEEGDAAYVSDINICYRREALESVRGLWEKRYQEASVHWALARRGRRLRLSEQPIVTHRRGRAKIWPVIKERVHWGRNFGLVRGRELSPFKRLVWAAVAPLLPALLFSRHLRRQLRKRRHMREFVLAIPATLLLLQFWCLGEFLGYCNTLVTPPARP